MKTKTRLIVLLLIVVLVLIACFLWPAFQVTTPDHYGRIVCVGLVKQYLSEKEEPLELLTTIDPYLKANLHLCERGVLPEPTKNKNVVVFNRDYLLPESPDWILIVLGKDIDSLIRGDWVITKSIESKRVRHAVQLVDTSDNLDYYYLYLTDANRPRSEEIDGSD
jgi:hypothetical protein